MLKKLSPVCIAVGDDVWELAPKHASNIPGMDGLDGFWINFPEDLRKRMQIFPNRFVQHYTEKRGKILLTPGGLGRKGDHALNRKLCTQTAAAVKVQGWEIDIRLWEVNWEVLFNERSVLLVYNMLKDIEPIPGKHGAYDWIGHEFQHLLPRSERSERIVGFQSIITV